MDITVEELKYLLQTPGMLFLLMILGSATNGLKQLRDAKYSGGNTSIVSYLGHWHETLATLIGNSLAFATLVVTDQLNFAAALGIGYMANSAADLVRANGRSASVQNTGLQQSSKDP